MKAAVIGLGSMGQKHYKILKQFKNLDVYSVDPASQMSNYKTTQDLLNDVQIDFAVIATPTIMHYDIALQLINSSVNILIEKPIFKEYLSFFQRQNLEDALKDNSCKLAVGHIERFNPAVEALKKDLKGKKIINCRFTRLSPYPKRITDVGVKMDLAVHDIDLVRFITGEEILNCSSLDSKTKSANEDTTSFFVSTYGGCSSTILCSWMSPYRERTIQVMTECSLYKVDLITHTVSRYVADQQVNSFFAEDLKVVKHNALEKELKQFMEYVKIGSVGSLATLNDGIEAIKYCI